MNGLSIFGVYLVIGLLMATLAIGIQLKVAGCPSRGTAILEFCLWTVLGPGGVGLAVLLSPIWLPIMLLVAAGEAWDGSRYERALTAWMAKPLCKPRR